MNAVTSKEHQQAARRLRELLAKYDEVELLVRIGEYKKGSDKVADEALEKHDALIEFLKQPTTERSEFAPTIEELRKLV